jgi:hypothetical protein
MGCITESRIGTMPQPCGYRALSVALALLPAALALGACSATHGLEEAPPAGYSLAGTWRLDPQRSTDSSKALQELRPHREPRRYESPGPTDPVALPPPPPYRPPIDMQTAELRGGNFLQIEQRPDEFIIVNGATRRSFTPGTHSVVSVSSGVADQVSGWKGRAYVIDINPQLGPRITEQYRLSDDGKDLIETIHIASEGRVPHVDVTRVYVPADRVPTPLPQGD